MIEIVAREMCPTCGGRGHDGKYDPDIPGFVACPTCDYPGRGSRPSSGVVTHVLATFADAAALTEVIARAFRSGELAWYLEHAPHIGRRCATYEDMNLNAKAANLAGATAVLAALGVSDENA